MSEYKHIDDFIKIPQLNNNDRLYHYTSAAGVKGITDGEFWITESHFLNDSTEFTIGTDICMEILEKHMRNPRRLLYAKDLLMEQMRKYYREEQCKYYVYLIIRFFKIRDIASSAHLPHAGNFRFYRKSCPMVQLILRNFSNPAKDVSQRCSYHLLM